MVVSLNRFDNCFGQWEAVCQMGIILRNYGREIVGCRNLDDSYNRFIAANSGGLNILKEFIMKKLKSIFNGLYAISSNEEAVERYFIECGVEQRVNKTTKEVPKLRGKGTKKENTLLITHQQFENNPRIHYDNRFSPDFFFISQPFGTQNHPDIIIVYYGWIIPIELKEGDCKIMLNSHLPISGLIYFFTQKKTNTNILCFGEDLPVRIDEEIRSMIQEFNDDSDRRANEFNEKLKEKTMNNGSYFCIYPRKMYDFAGTNIFTNNNSESTAILMERLKQIDEQVEQYE